MPGSKVCKMCGGPKGFFTSCLTCKPVEKKKRKRAPNPDKPKKAYPTLAKQMTADRRYVNRRRSTACLEAALLLREIYDSLGYRTIGGKLQILDAERLTARYGEIPGYLELLEVVFRVQRPRKINGKVYSPITRRFAKKIGTDML